MAAGSHRKGLPSVGVHSVGILGTGSYLPKEEVSNADVAGRAGVTPEWIVERTQIRARRNAAPAEATSDLAVQAALRALEQANLSPAEVDYIIVSTSTGDYPQPPTACLVQSALEALRAACLDINVVCAGFVYAIGVARGLLAGRPDARALVIAADVYSRFIDRSDRKFATLMGDGAGAAVVGCVPAPYGVLGLELSSRGDASTLVGVRAGGSRQPTSHETVEAGDHYLRMNGRGVRDFVMQHVPQAVANLVSQAGFGLDEVDHFVPHQPNGVLLGQLADACQLANAQTHRTIERYGNMGSASVAVTLDEANRSGALKDRDMVVLTGFGGGMSIGSCLIRWANSA
jgi:acetoacetyl-CoA synthase